MEKLRFSDDEKIKILNGMELVLQDIEKLWDRVKSATTEIYVYTYEHESRYGIGIRDNKLYISDEGIRLVDDYVIGSEPKIKWLKRFKEEPVDKKVPIFKPFSKKEKSEEIDYNLYYNFVKNYKEFTRVRLLREIDKRLEQKEEGMALVDDVQKEYDKSASIELIFQTQNRQEIEVTSEDGKTVGTLKFGGNIIKIVTNGDIVVKDKPTKQVKKK